MNDFSMNGGPIRLDVRNFSTQEQLLVQINKTLDAILQLQARLAMGWDPKEAIKDMGLKVPAVPGSA